MVTFICAPVSFPKGGLSVLMLRVCFSGLGEDIGASVAARLVFVRASLRAHMYIQYI